MGIKGLAKFIADVSPNSIKECDVQSLTGRVIAVDASSSIYQFLIAIRLDAQSHFANLSNQMGEVTSHLSGMLSRAIRLLESGCRPVYIFDGNPPLLKNGELARRKERREKAIEELALAKEEGISDEIKKQIARTMKMSKQHSESVSKMLQLMGLPVIQAPCEAEAQCAELCKRGLAWGVCTEDMDALTFGAPVLIRHLNFSGGNANSKNKNIIQTIHLDSVLKDLDVSMEEFIDFCILCGCDYSNTIKGMGNKTAFSYIKAHKNIETVIEKMDKKKFIVPSDFTFDDARQLFLKPDVSDCSNIKLVWKETNVPELKKFLIEENSFNETRVESYIQRLLKARGKSSQMRLDKFFQPQAKAPEEEKKEKKIEVGGLNVKKSISKKQNTKKPSKNGKK